MPDRKSSNSLIEMTEQRGLKQKLISQINNKTINCKHSSLFEKGFIASTQDRMNGIICFKDKIK
jgi:hypothetical protein